MIVRNFNEEFGGKRTIYSNGWNSTRLILKNDEMECRALSFPVLFHKFDRLLKRRLEDNYIDEWTIITEISQRTKNLENNFPEEQPA